MLREARRRQTLASFDYQWGHLPEGEAMLSDPWFVEHVDAIVADEMLAIERGWFASRTVLDAGCGGGRWTLGLLRLGGRVLAVDASAHAVASTRARMETLAGGAVAEGRLETARVDLLDIPDDLATRRFDLVFSFGVLHHTGDTRRALGNLARLVAPGGVLFVYLYGTPSAAPWARALVNGVRLALSPLPFPAKRAALARLLPRRDTHQAFDLLSPTINDTCSHDTVEGWLRELGFADVERTLPHTDVFLRALRAGGNVPRRALASPPFWFDRYRRRS